MKKFIRSFYVLFLITSILRAQEDSLAVRWLEMAEKDPSLTEQLQYLTVNPLNLNSARREDLTALPFISPQTAERILSYRRTHGSFKTVRPLRKILGPGLYRLVKPFFTIQSKQHIRGYWVQKNYFPMDPAAAALSYEGRLWSNYTREEYVFSNKWKAGFLFRKEAGEPDWFDYTTGYLKYSAEGQWILGNFQLQSGTGLLFSSPFASQKSSLVLLPLRAGGNKVRTGLSRSGNSLFGISYTRRFGPVNVMAFAAQNFLDARLAGDGQTVVGFDYDGYHRTQSELKGRNKISRQITGFSLSFPFTRRLNLSTIAAHYGFTPAIRRDREVVSESQQRKDYFAFSGRTLNVLSLSYQYEDSLLLLSGESAGSGRGGPAFAQKILLKTNPFRFGLMYWRAAKNFQSPQGHLFDNSTPFPQAIQGWYVAVKWQLLRGMEIKGYKLLKKDLWRSHQNTMPQIRDEWLIQARFAQRKQQVLLRLRQKKEDALVRTYYRLHYVRKVGKIIRLQTRVEYVKVNVPAERGLYVFQDIRWRGSARISLNTRFTAFSTSSFRSALYEYENDLPGSFSNYALYGQGHTWYALLHIQPLQNWQIWLKGRYLRRRNDFATPWEMRRDLRMGLRYRF